ncbi:Hypothetical predicted protein [Scomber scombrus]|uniref:Uncharacterized protein n=1 Tax=Scomber scombrus TaxID=13677 RepID=A0AAV1QK63_SCOSC
MLTVPRGKILCSATSPVPCKDRTGSRQNWTGLGPKPDQKQPRSGVLTRPGLKNS